MPIGIIGEMQAALEDKRRKGTLDADLAALDAKAKARFDAAQEIDKTEWKSGSGWEVHIGTVQLFIVGPGASQMWPVSMSNYVGQVGTDAERAAAKLAVAERLCGPAGYSRAGLHFKIKRSGCIRLGLTSC